MKSITEIPRESLRILFVRYSKKELVKLLGIKEHEYYALKQAKDLQTGCEFLNACTNEVIRVVLWPMFKSRAEMARFFKVSPSFLNKRFEKANIGFRNHLIMRFEDLKGALGFYGSKAIVAKLMGLNANDFNKLCRKHGIKHSDMSPVCSGFESSKGLAAEKEFEKVRGAHILENMNEKDPRAPWDYVDDKFLKVNVKASKAYYSRRHKGRYGKFNLTGGCDFYALYFYDDKFQKLLYWILVPAKKLPQKTLSIYHKDVKRFYLEGAINVFNLNLDEEFRRLIKNKPISPVVSDSQPSVSSQ